MLLTARRIPTSRPPFESGQCLNAIPWPLPSGGTAQAVGGAGRVDGNNTTTRYAPDGLSVRPADVGPSVNGYEWMAVLAS